MTSIIKTPRTWLKKLDHLDADFVIEITNDEDFIRYIGDKKIRSREDAKRYIDEGPNAMMARFGIGLLKVVCNISATPIGLCGLLQRDGLSQPDIGFAFLPEWRQQGYARECINATLELAQVHGEFKQLYALVHPRNTASAAVLQRCGFTQIVASEAQQRLFPATDFYQITLTVPAVPSSF